MKMLIFLFFITGLVFCFFFLSLSSLVKAGHRADKDEENLVNLIQQPCNRGDKVEKKLIVSAKI
ncbi:MAG: hypothetical protein COS76_03230 [Candidatus Portnoybacteria bacterium CG06_land_8_20_14_3_00_39_12]|uniref:Uncharacterized protein n=1 Tax=Candidatus Portnoybacteria bacterium CG06_land_8_20_14_3_00_39_12 TaxID=1974809 RepID=A0A2M7AWI0_9BACT|nr:MAG: hypothetical protein COS76_03230 [Candidatus Portnoybacteria bacterium CG06_land_8_20_14_3_00_39_12]